MSYVIVTPSFAGDYERCRLLAESVQRMVSNAEHYVLVDGVDVPLFKQLSGFGVRVVDTRELIKSHLYRIPTTRLWLTPRGKLLRGWITQQLRKLAFAYTSPFENLLCVDSDVVFVKPFDPESMSRSGKTPLFETDWFNAEGLGWANQSRRLLGLPEQAAAKGYVHPTFWRRSIIQNLLDMIEDRWQRPWQSKLAEMQTLSEYTLYGVFVREFIGLDSAGVYSFNRPLMHLSWDHDLHREGELEKFMSKITDVHVAIMFHSKDRLPVQRYDTAVRELWNQF